MKDITISSKMEVAILHPLEKVIFLMAPHVAVGISISMEDVRTPFLLGMKDIPISPKMEVAIPSSPKVGDCHPNSYGGGGHQSFVRRRWPPLSFREDGLPDVFYGEGDHLNIF